MKFMKESKFIETESKNLYDLKPIKNNNTLEKHLTKNSNILNEENEKYNGSEDILNTGFYVDYYDKELKK